MVTTATDDDVIRLAEFARRNPKTGAPELVRLVCSDFNGHRYLHARTWFKGRPNGPGDDGWRPTGSGVSFREQELDELAGAIEQARAIVRGEGRSTSGQAARPERFTSRRDRPRHHPAPAQAAARWADQDDADLPY